MAAPGEEVAMVARYSPPSPLPRPNRTVWEEVEEGLGGEDNSPPPSVLSLSKGATDAVAPLGGARDLKKGEARVKEEVS